MRLENKIAIVTGGVSGLGLFTANFLISEGCKVVVADLNDTAGNELVQKVGSDKIMYIKTDVSQEENVKELIKQTVNKFGGLHIVVNCAGIINVAPTISSKGVASTQEMIKVLQVNVIGTFNVSKWAAYQMAKQNYIDDTKERGVIINVASVAGFEGQRGQVIYSASKGAIIGMTLPMARDLGKYGIRIMTLAPGTFMTPMMHQINTKVKENLEKSTPLGRLGDPQEFAHMVATICQNSYLTGEVIRLDGGVRLPYL